SEGIHLLAATKNNLGPLAPTLAYRVGQNAEGLPVLEWLGTSASAANDLVLPTGRRFGESVDRAIEFLKEALYAATRPQAMVRAEAAVQGISRRTLDR